MKGFGQHNSQVKVLQGGFTIIETLIVLTITGVLFVAFVTTIQGQQSRAKFRQGANAFKTQLDQLITQSQSGYYPPGGFQCTKVGTIVNINSGSTNEQGTNDDCMLLGKAIQFNTTATDPQVYTVYPITGVNGKTDADFPDSYADTNPKVVDTAGVQRDVALEQGLTVLWARSGGANIGAVAFTLPFTAASGSPTYGSNTTEVRGVTTVLNLPKPAQVAQLNARLRTATVGQVQICVVSGTTNESGLITIGGNRGANTVSLSVRENRTCA